VIDALSDRLATGTARDKAEAAIGAAIETGKLVPALRDHFIARHMKNPTEVETELKVMPSLNAGGLSGRTLPDNGGTLTAEDDKVMAMMGVPSACKTSMRRSSTGTMQETPSLS